jgi:hypothetical protein
MDFPADFSIRDSYMLKSTEELMVKQSKNS